MHILELTIAGEYEAELMLEVFTRYKAEQEAEAALNKDIADMTSERRKRCGYGGKAAYALRAQTHANAARYAAGWIEELRTWLDETHPGWNDLPFN